MQVRELRFGPGVPDLAALGARSAEELFGLDGGLRAEQRAETISRDACSVLLRLPLPGTPDACGRLVDRPRGAGTGHVFVRRFERAGLARALRARLSRPRSTSLAAREWNLICALRARGVTTPEPLAVGALGAGPFATRSVLVTRELAGLTPLPTWLERERGAAARARRELATAFGLALRRTFDAGIWLPRLAPRHVLVGETRAAGCAAATPAALALLERSPLPEIAFAGFADGRLVSTIGGQRRATWLGRFARELGASQAVGVRDAARVLRNALGRAPSRAERRAAWRTASARSGRAR